MDTWVLLLWTESLYSSGPHLQGRLQSSGARWSNQWPILQEVTTVMQGLCTSHVSTLLHFLILMVGFKITHTTCQTAQDNAASHSANSFDIFKSHLCKWQSGPHHKTPSPRSHPGWKSRSLTTPEVREDSKLQPSMMCFNNVKQKMIMTQPPQKRTASTNINAQGEI